MVLQISIHRAFDLFLASSRSNPVQMAMEPMKKAGEKEPEYLEIKSRFSAADGGIGASTLTPSCPSSLTAFSARAFPGLSHPEPFGPLELCSAREHHQKSIPWPRTNFSHNSRVDPGIIEITEFELMGSLHGKSDHFHMR